MGPLAGLKIIEFAGIGPGPFCATLLADLGADILRVDRTSASDLGFPSEPQFDPLGRGRDSICIDLKQAAAVPLVLQLVSKADGLIEGFRPGVMERLGLGPEPCAQRNRALVYGRITGWGQDGPMANTVGHDINYIALSGALASIGPANHRPVPPLNLLGDYGGGGMFLAVGMLAALMQARQSGIGQVVDSAMSEGAAYLSLPLFGWRSAGIWDAPRGENLLDGGAPWYDTYQTRDARWISIGAIEDKFYRQLLAALEMDPQQVPDRSNRDHWPALRDLFSNKFQSRSRDEWCAHFENFDACFAPVLEADELATHPQHKQRQAFIEINGLVQPAPSPRFSRSVPQTPSATRAPGEGGQSALQRWGIDEQEIDSLREQGIIHYQ